MAIENSFIGNDACLENSVKSIVLIIRISLPNNETGFVTLTD
jgi:hypothetical protein